MENHRIEELVIKNMICSRCLKVLRQEMEAMGVEILDLQLGKIKIRFPSDKLSLDVIEEKLKEDYFEIVKSHDEIVYEKIKLALIDLVNALPLSQEKVLSDYLSHILHKDHWTLSKIFSKTGGITIEKYFILLKIEKVKELIEYDQMNFTEIAYELGYRNIFHLSNQFKQVTGMSMSAYKKLPEKKRKPLDKII